MVALPEDYQVIIRNTAGVRQYVLDMTYDVRSLVIEHRVNTPSTLTLGLYGLSPAVAFFALDALIEVRRKAVLAVPELQWYTEFIGFHRTPQRQITSANNRIFTAYVRGLLDLIRRRSILYYADTAGSAKGPAAADNVMKAYVRENAGSTATVANGRVVAGQTTGLTVAADTSQAASYEGANAWRNLLDALHDIGEPNNVDFDVVWTGGVTWDFRTYYPQLGTDRREGNGVNIPMVFSTSLGNMAEPSLTQSRTDEVTKAIVLGPGESTFRDVTVITGTHVSDSPWNNIEQTIDASSEDTAAALTAIGNGLLYDKRPAVSFTFAPIETPQSVYGQHYFLGDLVTGTFDDQTANVKIRAVTISVGDGAEKISLELEEVV